jgi:putative thioredoxin
MSYETTNFNDDVLQQSNIKPVLVYYWTSSSAPCNVLGSVLENLAAQAKNAWALVKINTRAPETLAAEHGNPAIPTVKVFYREKVIAAFTGAKTESELRVWLENSLPELKVDPLLRTADWIRLGNARDAVRMLSELLKSNKGDHALAALTARSLVFSDPDGALALIDGIPSERPYDEAAHIVRVFSRLFAILDDPGSYLPETPLRDRYLSGALDLRRERFDEALGHFIAVLEDVPDYDDGQTKAVCLAMINHLGETHPVIQRRMAQFKAATGN